MKTSKIPAWAEWSLRIFVVCMFFVVTPFIAIPVYGIVKIALILAFNMGHPEPVDVYVREHGKLG